MRHKIYEVYKFYAAKSWYKVIIQKSPPEGVRFTTDRGYITQEEGYIPNYL